jgi:hypothetical protein
MAPFVEMLPTNFLPLGVPPSFVPELVPESGLDPESDSKPKLEEPDPELDPPPDVELSLVPEPVLEPEEEEAPPPELEPAADPGPPSSPE